MLPPPANDDDAYLLVVSNESDATLVLANDPVVNATVDLESRQAVEVSLEFEIQDDAQTTHTYRTDVFVLAGGVERVPGFTGSPP